MPFTQQLLLNIPTFPLALIVVASSALLATITILVTHLLFYYLKPKKYTKVMPMFFGAIILMYSILLALILVTSWLGFNDTAMDVQKEANCLIELYRSTDAFLPNLKDEARTLLEQYAKSIINDEWKTLAKSELNPGTTQIAKNLWQVYTSYTPRTQTEQIFIQESIRTLSKLREYRTVRLSDSKIGVYPTLWLILLIGELITVAFINFLAEDLKTKLFISLLFSTLIGIIFFTILLFDFPFTGQIITSVEPFKQAIIYW